MHVTLACHKPTTCHLILAKLSLALVKFAFEPVYLLCARSHG